MAIVMISKYVELGLRLNATFDAHLKGFHKLLSNDKKLNLVDSQIGKKLYILLYNQGRIQILFLGHIWYDKNLIVWN